MPIPYLPNPWITIPAGAYAYYKCYRIVTDERWMDWAVGNLPGPPAPAAPPYVPSKPYINPVAAALPEGWPRKTVYPASDYPFGQTLVQQR